MYCSPVFSNSLIEVDHLLSTFLTMERGEFRHLATCDVLTEPDIDVLHVYEKVECSKVAKSTMASSRVDVVVV